VPVPPPRENDRPAPVPANGRPGPVRGHIDPAEFARQLDAPRKRQRQRIAAQAFPVDHGADGMRLVAWVRNRAEEAGRVVPAQAETLASLAGFDEVLVEGAGNRAGTAPSTATGGTASPASLAAVGRRADWVWILEAGERVLPGAVSRVRRVLGQIDSPMVVGFDHCHADREGTLYGPVFKPSWDPWLAATAPDFDCGWIVHASLLKAFGAGPDSLYSPTEVLLDGGLKVDTVALTVLARPDLALAGAARAAVHRRAWTGWASRSQPARQPGLHVLDDGRPDRLAVTLQSLTELERPPGSVTIHRRPGTSPGCMGRSWPDHWRWVDEEKPAGHEPVVFLRAGVRLSGWQPVMDHLGCFCHRQVTAVGLAVTGPGGRIGAGRVIGHQARSMKPNAPWPGGFPGDGPVLRRFSQLTWDFALAIPDRLDPAFLAQLAAGDDGSQVTAGEEGVLLASSETAGSSPAQSGLPRLAGDGADPCFSIRMSLDDSRWLADPATAAWAPAACPGSRVVALTPDEWGSSHYRLRHPLQALQVAGAVAPPAIHTLDRVRVPGIAGIDRLDPEVVVVQNHFSDPVLELLEALASRPGVRTVLLLDDLITNLPPGHPMVGRQRSDLEGRLGRAMERVDEVVVTTDELADRLALGRARPRVIPDSVPASFHALGRPAERRPPGDRRLRVGWAGASQHEADLRLLKPVVRALAERVDWIFFGLCPDYLRPCAAEVHPGVAFDDYPWALRDIGLDLALAPLQDHPYNRCKSPVKLLEFGMLDTPVIASDLPPYRGLPCIRVDNSAQAWIKAVEDYDHDRQALIVDGRALGDRVRSDHVMSRRQTQWARVLANPRTAKK